MNVGFAEVRSPEQIRLRVWERGTGLTKACGTGACAAVVAAHRQGRTGRKVEILADGGSLEIEWRAGDDRVLMTGPIELEATGEIPAAWTRRRQPDVCGRLRHWRFDNAAGPAAARLLDQS